MVRTDAALYLPISDRMLGTLLDEPTNFTAAIASFSVAQIAALILLQSLPKLAASASPLLDRILVETINHGNAHVTRDGASAFADAAIGSMDRAKLREGRTLLAQFGIVLLDDDAVRGRDYLTVDGQWDSSFRERQRDRLATWQQKLPPLAGRARVLTPEQSRIFREVKAQADDHMHVQGYAGTGKSFLIKSLLTLHERASVLVLAERQRQLDALLSGMDRLPHVHPRRFGTLISEMVPTDLTDPASLRMRRVSHSAKQIPDDDVVRHLMIHPHGAFSARDVVRAVRRTVIRFCYSGDREIDAQHIPDAYAAAFDSTMRSVVLHHATELWKATLLSPSQDFQPPLRNYHRIKWAALHGWKIPARYTHVLIDECHDLAKPMLQILDVSPQAVISLGDEYQNLDGRPQQRFHNIRHRAVVCSVRSGQLLEGIVNPIIDAHPGRTKLPFHGNPLHRTEVVYYDKPQIPDRPAVILVNDTWGLLEWVQRLAAQDVDFELLSSRDNLNIFVGDCIELYKHGTRPRHGELFRFDSWQALATRYHDNRGFQRIDRMLQRGYQHGDWNKTLAKLAGAAKHGFAVGLVGDVRNREFDDVVLAVDIPDRRLDVTSGEFAAISSVIYVSVTRAQRRLIVPERFRDWLEEISARQSGIQKPRATLPG